jgi:hypothetical protein
VSSSLWSGCDLKFVVSNGQGNLFGRLNLLLLFFGMSFNFLLLLLSRFLFMLFLLDLFVLLLLMLLLFLLLRGLLLGSWFLGNGLVLVLFEFLQVGSDVFQELLLDVHQLLLLHGDLLIVDVVVLLHGLLQLRLLLRHFQVLLTSEFSLENVLHHFLLTGLQRLVVQGTTQIHH